MGVLYGQKVGLLSDEQSRHGTGLIKMDVILSIIFLKIALHSIISGIPRNSNPKKCKIRLWASCIRSLYLGLYLHAMISKFSWWNMQHPDMVTHFI